MCKKMHITFLEVIEKILQINQGGKRERRTGQSNCANPYNNAYNMHLQLSCKIFVPRSSESLDGDTFHVFGNDVVSLARHFHDYGISETDFLQDWNQLKYELLHQGQERVPLG